MSYPPSNPGYPAYPPAAPSNPGYPPSSGVGGIGFESLMISPPPSQPAAPYPTGPSPMPGYGGAPAAPYGPGSGMPAAPPANQFPLPSHMGFAGAASVAHAAAAFQAPTRPMPAPTPNYGAPGYPNAGPPYQPVPPPVVAPAVVAPPVVAPQSYHDPYTRGGSVHGAPVPPPASVQQHNQSFHGTPSAPAANMQRNQQSFHGVPANPSVLPKSNPPAKQATKAPNRGTVKPCPSFKPQVDAEAIRKAVGGFGTNVKEIIGILSTRNNQQRIKIALEYKTQFGRDLNTDLKFALGGSLENLLLGMMQAPAVYDATELRRAMKGLGTTESVLIEILCSRTNEEIKEVKQEYRKLYSRDLEKDVHSETSGHFRKFLISLLQANRDESTNVDYGRARADADALHQAGEKRWGTDEARFNAIFAARSFAQLRATFNEYAKISKYDIEKSVEREMSGDLKNAMVTLVQCVRNTPAYFAKKLYKSMKGLGTDDATLIRVVVTRCEVDMIDIKQEFQRQYHKTLASFIKGDTSGNYCKTLLGLIGEPQN
ncbi:annexin A4-like [Dendronephthya gigantea]|uniref:annexin A4-like n=1 Tax=Dendronephthya gigantea TaxID=151771 RepID=UPI00106A34DE|nr:annexin A4-like [Dendronephthya gigantea]XP_028408366.1 annexin A4-like [Dendronephthya gigantea]